MLVAKSYANLLLATTVIMNRN